MDRNAARRLQYRRSSFYAVYLIGPKGECELIGRTQRKSGVGLRNILSLESVQSRIKQWPCADSLTFTKHADRLELSNGWRIEFGGTILQETDPYHRSL